MTARLYLDEDVTPLLARALRQRGYDVVSAIELGRIGMSDEDHLSFAVSERRTLLTFNISDYAALYRKWRACGKHHFGIIISQQFSKARFGELLRRVLQLLSVWDEDTLKDQMVYLGKY